MKINMDASNFSVTECKCKCCNLMIVDYRLVMWLENFRNLIRVTHNKDYKIIINSWTRCKEHNARVGGVKDSQHLLGLAVDFVVMDKNGAVKSKDYEKEFEMMRNQISYTYDIDEYSKHIDMRVKE